MLKAGDGMAEEFSVDIANIATGFFGEDDQISDPLESSKPARTVRAAWSMVRKFVRTKGNWSCGKRRSRIGLRAANPLYPVLPPYRNAYPLPPRFSRLVQILAPASLADDYQIVSGPAGREIHCDHAGALEIEWQEDIVDWARWSDEFTEAFAMRLAWQIADRLSGDKQRKQQALDAYKTALNEGRNSDARQQPPLRHAQGDWSRARSAGVGRAPNT